MKKLFLAVLLPVLLLSACKATRKLQQTDTSTTQTETVKQQTTRQGDTVTAYRPVNIKYKDTTIYTVSYDTKQVIREVYDSEGNQQIDCISDEIMDLIEKTTMLVENDITLSDDRETKFNPAGFIWAIAGLGVVVLGLVIYLPIAMARAKAGTINEIKSLLDR